ncbi:hypothetical protein [Halocatena marina]|uniref:hypothetical protein n=1 Tax=Halocatena marina TaxID=2934937 RepID=UPI00222590A6|nr:hypothetical protein [Halocatena marina]
MRRRVLLVSLGSLVTGCLASSADREYHIADLSVTSTPDHSSAIAFTASVSNQRVSPDSRGALSLSLTNNSRETQEVVAGTVPPFGVVTATRVDDSGQFLLWRNYEDEGCVNITDGAVCSIGSITELSPGERLSRRYEILPPTTEIHPKKTVPPGAGRYRISDTLSYSTGAGSQRTELSFDVEFTLKAVA